MWKWYLCRRKLQVSLNCFSDTLIDPAFVFLMICFVYSDLFVGCRVMFDEYCLYLVWIQ